MKSWTRTSCSASQRGASLLSDRACSTSARQAVPSRLAAGESATKRMQAINEAWQTISDQHRRARGPAAPAAWHWPSSGQQEWHGARAATVAHRSDESSSGRTGVLVLAGMMLLLALILVAGMIAAADGPALPGPYAPIKHNLDSP